jgi:D-mannonate dehydratase
MSFDFRCVRQLPVLEKINLCCGVMFVRTFQDMPNVANQFSQVMKMNAVEIRWLKQALVPAFDTQWPHREIDRL